jgi:hypothetical protein
MSASHPTQTSAPFASLAEMQERHAALAKEVGSGILTPGHTDRIVDFVHRGLATGKILDAKEERAAAQGLINFWSSRLASAAREARQTRSVTVGYSVPSGVAPEFEDTLLAEFDPETIRSAAGAAERWLGTLSEDDQRIARRVMLRLVRLSSTSGTFEPVPSTRAALQEVDPSSEKVDAVIARLAADGVLRVTRGTTAETDQVSLRDKSLLTAWGSYAKWLEERKTFRESVESWDRGGRRTHALLTSEALNEARFYSALNPIERQFIEESRREEIWLSEKNKWLKYVFGALAGVALAGLLGTSISAYQWQVKGREAAENAKRADQQSQLAKKHADQLEEKQQFSEAITLIRSLCLSAAETGTGSEAERDIAFKRLEMTRKLATKQGEIGRLYAKVEAILKDIREHGGSEEDFKKVQRTALNLARVYKDKALKNSTSEDTTKPLVDEREIVFAVVEYCADQIVKVAEGPGPYHDADPYLKEFWVLYWGEMGLVEGEQVERAMVQFGDSLKRIDERLAGQIRSSKEFLKDPAVLKGLTNRQAIQHYYAQAKAVAKSSLNLENVAAARVDPKTELPQLRQNLETLKQALAAEIQQPLQLEQPLGEAY